MPSVKTEKASPGVASSSVSPESYSNFSVAPNIPGLFSITTSTFTVEPDVSVIDLTEIMGVPFATTLQGAIIVSIIVKDNNNDNNFFVFIVVFLSLINCYISIIYFKINGLKIIIHNITVKTFQSYGATA